MASQISKGIAAGSPYAPRLGDDSYAIKIVIDSLIESSGARDSETGAGIMLGPNAEDQYNDDSPSIIINLIDGTISRPGRPT